MSTIEPNGEEYSGEQPWHDEELLRQLYLAEDLSMREVAERIGCSIGTVSRWIGRHEIPADPPGGEPAAPEIRNPETLRRLYAGEKMTSTEIAGRFGCSPRCVRWWLENHGIEIRARGGAPIDELRDGDLLREWYLGDGLTTREIADKCECSPITVSEWLHRHNIPIPKRGSWVQSGEDHPLWEGGEQNYGPLWPEQREKAIQRDGEQCRRCGLSRTAYRERFGSDIPVHHIVPYRAFESDEKAHQPTNLITFCVSCHRRMEGLPIDNRQ